MMEIDRVNCETKLERNDIENAKEQMNLGGGWWEHLICLGAQPSYWRDNDKRRMAVWWLRSSLHSSNLVDSSKMEKHVHSKVRYCIAEK